MANVASITFTPKRARDVRKVVCDCASAADGSCSFSTELLSGYFLQEVIINPAGGADAPSAAWDLTITQEDGLDVIGAQGANLSETDTVSKAPYRAAAAVAELPVHGALTLNITNAGDGKKIQISLVGRTR
jgi:hypothetical protein